MRMVDVIEKKRDGHVLTDEEIQFFIEGYTRGEIPDYQASSLAMAIYFQGMNNEERAALTMAMVNSGETIDLTSIEGIKVDKHSTGGVGDTTTLILAPLVASVGVPVAKMSGRGLGHTGGTLDKLESIPGFHVELSQQQFIDLVNQNKVAVMGQSGNLTPADKKLYALRDVTGSVNSISLIASSIMSKKIAAGADAIVLDVKVGHGAFMKTRQEAQVLAEAMVQIGNEVGRQTMAIISDMDQPLGKAIGNALEVKEAIDTLKGEGPEDLTELVLTLGAQMVVLGGRATDLTQAKQLLQEAIHSGEAIEKFRDFVEAQGGDSKVIDHPERLPQATYQLEVPAEKFGYISEINAHELGVATMMLGAGRQTKDDVIQLEVGMVLNKKVGDPVQRGESLVTIHSNREEMSEVVEKVQRNIEISSERVTPQLIHSIVTE